MIFAVWQSYSSNFKYSVSSHVGPVFDKGWSCSMSSTHSMKPLSQPVHCRAKPSGRINTQSHMRCCSDLQLFTNTRSDYFWTFGTENCKNLHSCSSSWLQQQQQQVASIVEELEGKRSWLHELNISERRAGEREPDSLRWALRSVSQFKGFFTWHLVSSADFLPRCLTLHQDGRPNETQCYFEQTYDFLMQYSYLYVKDSWHKVYWWWGPLTHQCVVGVFGSTSCTVHTLQWMNQIQLSQWLWNK